MASMPLPTVVIPAFNAGATVARAVASARDQAGRVIVVDDGSGDETAGVAAKAGAEVLRQANAGPARARNAALDVVDPGCPVLFLDADDELLPGAVHVIAGALAGRPDGAAVIGGHIAVAPDGTATPRLPEREWVEAGALPSRGLALGPYHVFCTTGLTLAPPAARTLRFDPALHFAEDRDLIYRAGALGPIGVVAGPLVRKHIGAGLTDNPAKVQRWLLDQLALVAKHCPAQDARAGEFEPLARCTQWVVKHALRTGARHGRPLDLAAWAAVREAFSERGWPLGASLRRAYWTARIKAAWSGPSGASA
jgi:hypothetical protein